MALIDLLEQPMNAYWSVKSSAGPKHVDNNDYNRVNAEQGELKTWSVRRVRDDA
jgi:hypothetical protein